MVRNRLCVFAGRPEIRAEVQARNDHYMAAITSIILKIVGTCGLNVNLSRVYVPVRFGGKEANGQIL